MSCCMTGTLPGPAPEEVEEEEEVEGRKPGRQRANSSYTDACCCDGPPTCIGYVEQFYSTFFLGIVLHVHTHTPNNYNNS